MAQLPTKSEIRKLFPDYVVSLTNDEALIPVAEWEGATVPVLIVTKVAHRTDRLHGRPAGSLGHDRYTNHPVEMSEGDMFDAVKNAGYNVIIHVKGVVILPANVVYFRRHR